MNQNRLDYIDMARGIAMMVVIWWHCHLPHMEWSDGWVMPIFFIIMGMFYKDVGDFKTMLVKKTNQLVVPFVLFSIPAVIAKILSEGLAETTRQVLNPYQCANGPSWFLVCMFVCYLLYFGVNKIAKGQKVIRIGIILILSLAGFYSSDLHIGGHRIVLPFFITTALSCMCFIEIGRQICKPLIVSRGGVIETIVFTSLYILDVVLLHPRTSDFVWADWAVTYPKFIFNGFVGAGFMMLICRYAGMVRIRFLLWPLITMGKLSLLMLIVHIYVVDYVAKSLWASSWESFIVTVVVTTIMAWYIDKYFPALCGKRQIIKLN